MDRMYDISVMQSSLAVDVRTFWRGSSTPETGGEELGIKTLPSNRSGIYAEIHMLVSH